MLAVWNSAHVLVLVIMNTMEPLLRCYRRNWWNETKTVFVHYKNIWQPVVVSKQKNPVIHQVPGITDTPTLKVTPTHRIIWAIITWYDTLQLCRCQWQCYVLASIYSTHQKWLHPATLISANLQKTCSTRDTVSFYWKTKIIELGLLLFLSRELWQ